MWLIILIILVIFYWIRRILYKTETVVDMVNRSSGTWDDAAKSAYVAANEAIKRDPKSKRFMRARIAANNIIRGGVQLPAAEHNALLQQIGEDFAVAVAYPAENDYAPEFIADQAIQWYVATNQHVPGIVEAAGQNRIGQNRQLAAETASNRAEFVDNYLTGLTQYTSDPQNVHDSAVNNDLRGMLGAIRAANGRGGVKLNTGQYEAEIRAAIATLPQGKKSAALATLAAMSANNYVSTFDASERDILHTVWSRTHHPDNAGNEQNVRAAIVEALADASQGGNTVCINGRCGRVIDSLARIDRDSTFDGAKTSEAYRNQIFDETRKMIDDRIVNLRNDPTMTELARSYEDPSVEVPAEQSERFRSEMTQSINTLVDGYKDKLSEAQLDKVRSEAIAAIE